MPPEPCQRGGVLDTHRKRWFRVKEELSQALDLGCCKHTPPMSSSVLLSNKQRIAARISGRCMQDTERTNMGLSQVTRS